LILCVYSLDCLFLKAEERDILIDLILLKIYYVNIKIGNFIFLLFFFYNYVFYYLRYIHKFGMRFFLFNMFMNSWKTKTLAIQTNIKSQQKQLLAFALTGNEQARRGEQEREMQQRRQRATEDGKGESDSCGANATKCIKLIIVAFKTLVVAGTKEQQIDLFTMLFQNN